MKRIWLYIPIAVIIAALFVTGCTSRIDAGGKVLAKVSNKAITLKTFQEKIAKMPAYYRNIVEKNRKRYLDEMIVEMLFYEEAVRLGIDKDKEVKEILNEARKKIIIAKLIKNEVEDKSAVSEEDIKRFYEENKDKFKTPPMWRASHILVATEPEARTIQDELAKGASFEELAKTRSTDPTAVRLGDIGFFRQGQLVPEFEAACLKLEVGQTSDIVHTQFGYHIIRLTDKKEPQLQSFEEARRAIESELKKGKRSVLFDDLVQRLKKKYGVEIKEDVIESLGETKKDE
jgi:peptidyl-prolyl cis-trans isomerase C